MPEKGGIFISYRRGPATWAAIAMRDLMRQRFPSAEVFHDGTSIDGGADWPARLRAALDGCEVLLALIDADWETVQKGGRRRLDIEEDWVRNEIAHALEAGKAVIPILLDREAMPGDATALPRCLRPLLERQAMPLRASGRDDLSDRAAIADTIAPHLPGAASDEPPAAPPAPPAPEGTIPIADAVALIAEVAPDTRALAQLASGTYDEGRFALAEALFAEATARFAEEAGPDAPQTLTARHNTASAILDQGRAAEAEGLFRDLLPVRERVQGAENPASLVTRHEHARAVLNRGLAADAERLYRYLLSVAERVQGAEHPETLTTRHTLASAALTQGRAAEAEGLFRDLLPIRERVQGAEYPETLTTRHNLATAVLEQGRAAEAEGLFRDLLPIRERVHGAGHPAPLVTRRALARAALERGDVARAREALAPLPEDGGDPAPLRKGQTALLRAWIADLDGDRARAEAGLAAAEGHLADLAPEHYARRALDCYRATRRADGTGATTLWMRRG